MESNKRQEIAKEHGMPFKETIKGYADMGYSMTMTAKIVGFSVSSFIRLCDARDWRHWFKTAHDCLGHKEGYEYRKGQFTEAQRKSLIKARKINPRYITLEYRGITDTFAGHAKRYNINLKTAYNRRYKCNKELNQKDLDYIFNPKKHPNKTK